MGTSSSRRSNKPEYLKELLQSSQNELKKYKDEKIGTINNITKEIEEYLKSKDINSSKEKMKKILKEEDDLIIYDILNRILESLINKVTCLSERKECPIELRPPMNTVIYVAPKLKIKQLKEFRDIFNEKYGKEYIKKIDNDEDHLINEVLIEKLKDNIYSEQLINMRLKLICQNKNIDCQLTDSLDVQASSEITNSSIFRQVNTIRNSSLISYHKSSIQPGERKELAKSKKNRESQNKKEDKKVIDNSDKYSDEFEKIKNDDPLKRVKTIDDPIQEGENLFLPYDEKIDEKCYSINKIDNWAEEFYYLKTGFILEKYKELLSKSEFSTFFEGLNYEYGINNYPLDLQKAFDIYKKAADSTTDTLSMYRLYHIYKKDFKKFNIQNINNILEKFYIMKCFTYLTEFEKKDELFRRFDINEEIWSLITDENNMFYSWYSEYFDFLMENYSYYNISKDDINMIEAVIYYHFQSKESSVTDIMDNKMFDLIKKSNPHAMYNLVTFYKEEKKYYKYYEELCKVNYYRSFATYAKIIAKDEKDKALTILKSSITNGYIGYIKWYNQIFMLNNDIEDIVKSPTLKSELLFIMKYFLDNFIFDDIICVSDLNYMRNILIKHYNFENEFKNNIDPYLKEIVNYINNLMKGNDDENKKKTQSDYIINYFCLIDTLYGSLCYYGIKGIMDKNYNETLSKFNYLLKNQKGLYEDILYLYYIYQIKNKQRKLNQENNKVEDKELIELEKKLLNLFYQDLSPEKIKKYPPTFFYYLSRLFRNNTIKTKDLILEYIFLNRAANANILESLDFTEQMFEKKYLKMKAKKKVKEKSKEENFKKIREGKGAISVEGYGEDGMTCPICLENKKSIIALPCKHFFCNYCMTRLLDAGNCPICRTEIKITFDIDSKKETLIKSKIIHNSFDPFGNSYDEPFNDIFDNISAD